MSDESSAMRVRSCYELEAGAEIEARVGGEKHFEGQVTETHSKLRLFWAVDGVGVRRLIELDEFEVYRLA